MKCRESGLNVVLVGPGDSDEKGEGMRQIDDECMGCSKRPEVEVIARTMDGELVIDRATLCLACAERDLGGALLGPDLVRQVLTSRSLVARDGAEEIG